MLAMDVGIIFIASETLSCLGAVNNISTMLKDISSPCTRGLTQLAQTDR